MASHEVTAIISPNIEFHLNTSRAWNVNYNNSKAYEEFGVHAPTPCLWGYIGEWWEKLSESTGGCWVGGGAPYVRGAAAALTSRGRHGNCRAWNRLPKWEPGVLMTFEENEICHVRMCVCSSAARGVWQKQLAGVAPLLWSSESVLTKTPYKLFT